MYLHLHIEPNCLQGGCGSSVITRLSLSIYTSASNTVFRGGAAEVGLCLLVLGAGGGEGEGPDTAALCYSSSDLQWADTECQ